jgi:hypothetical protein
MHKAHDVQSVSFVGTTMVLQVDGNEYRIDITRQSARLARATPDQRNRFEVSPAGYGIHWPELDEDLSIDGLIGVKHSSPFVRTDA